MKTKKNKVKMAVLCLCATLVVGATGIMTVMAESHTVSATDLPPTTYAAPVAIDEARGAEDAVFATDSDLPDESGSADLDAAMANANDYARDTYGIVVDESLNLENSMYRYPGFTQIDADQDVVEQKCREIVDFTFAQFLRRVSAEQLRSAGIHCRVYVEADGEALNCYCLYA